MQMQLTAEELRKSRWGPCSVLWHMKGSVLSWMPTIQRHHKSAPAFEKLCFICAFFHMPVLDGCENQGFQRVIPEIFWYKCKGASPALPCASVNRINISHERRTSNDLRKQPNREIHSVGLLVEGIYSMLWTIHLVPEFKWGAGVGVERAGKHSSLVKMKEWV